MDEMVARLVSCAGSGLPGEDLAIMGQKAASMLPGRPDRAGGLINDGQARPGVFCVVANVLDETAHGHGGAEIRRGAEHFPAGAKVWVLPPQRGDGGNLVIVAGITAAPAAGPGQDHHPAQASDTIPCPGRLQPGPDPCHHQAPGRTGLGQPPAAMGDQAASRGNRRDLAASDNRHHAVRQSRFRPLPPA